VREQWVDDGSGWRKSVFAGGGTTLRTATLSDANDGGPNYSKVSLYFRRGILQEGTLYFADHRIGTTFDAVAPIAQER
jgi:hypothetical protein